MDVLEIITTALAGRNTVEIKELAARSGVAWSTIYKIASKRALDPRWSTVVRLANTMGIKEPALTSADRKRLFKHLDPKKARGARR